MVHPLWRTLWRFLKKIIIVELPYDLAIPLLGIYLEKNIVQKDISTPGFIAALFTIAKTWKHPKCPLTEEWMKKIQYIYTRDYYSDREGNGTPLQYSCLESPMDGGAWWAAAHGVARSRSRLSDFTFTFHFHALEKEMVTHSSVLAWRISGTGEPGGCHLWGHTESDTTEVT